ncbi:MAG: tetratricopeptide repeat protein [Novosphingobium sp.]
MTWILILLITGIVFAVMAFVLKLPRSGWEITGAALLFGIAGYALQGHPGQAGAPHPAAETAKLADEALLKERQQMGSAFGKGQTWLILADALTRQGQYGAAADVLRNAIAKTPRDPDLWVALGNALVGHSDGIISPAAQYAFQKAADIAPDHPGPPFFMGLALAQTGRLTEARTLWAQLLAHSAPDAPYRADLEARLARLDSMLAAQGQGGAGAEADGAEQLTPPPASDTP